MRAIDSVSPIKKVRREANSKSWFHKGAISAVQKETNYIEGKEASYRNGQI